jgi:hypothetical protein
MGRKGVEEGGVVLSFVSMYNHVTLHVTRLTNYRSSLFLLIVLSLNLDPNIVNHSDTLSSLQQIRIVKLVSLNSAN